MKKFLLILTIFFISAQTLLAQVPTPPPPPDEFEENASGPGAPSALPVDQYVFILLGLAIAIGLYYFFILNKRKAYN